MALSLLVFTFYVGIPPLEGYGLAAGRRNYGGMCNGFRWSFWLIPLWLMFLPRGLVVAVRTRPVALLALVMLGVSVMSAIYATRNPWTRPWLHQMLYVQGWIEY